MGTAAGALFIGMFVILGWNDWPDFLFAVVGTAIVWVAHHDNIGRLLRGEERKFDPFARGDTRATASGAKHPRAARPEGAGEHQRSSRRPC